MAATGEWPEGKPKIIPSEVDTMILIDVDGVLNVGAADEGKTPILFNDTNLRFAQRLWSHRKNHPERKTIEKLIAISQKRAVEQDPDTMAKLVAKTPSHVSEVLVERLADILQAAGPRAIAVLSSTWQAARHKARVQDLEKAVSRCMGRAFEFDAVTGSSEEKTPDGRLEAIGNFVAASTSPGGPAAAAAAAGCLKILVLEDFFIMPLSGAWSCQGKPMDSAKTVEDFIRSKIPIPQSGLVKLLHTYCEWRTEAGMHIRAGVGLNRQDVEDAKEFLALSLDTVIPQDSKKHSTTSIAGAPIIHTEAKTSDGPALPEVSEVRDGSSIFGLSCFNASKPSPVQLVAAR